MSVKPIPVLRPQLPTADQLLAHLRRIDDARIYSNWGPLCLEFQDRICDQLSLPKGAFVTACSGTAALMGAILAAASTPKMDRCLAVMPAFTFVATAIAAERCGYQPYFCDVGPESWMLDPLQLESQVFLERVGLVIPVAPFGKPVPQAPWAAFQSKTGIPVVIDGAASFDRIMKTPAEFVGTIPLALSFHATKCFGIGEGGGVLMTNSDLAQGVTRALNFGFDQDRDCRNASFNGKLSEYHAAVGLAELDGWQVKASMMLDVADTYRRRLGERGMFDRGVLAPEISCSYALFKSCSIAETRTVTKKLREAMANFRMWYGLGVHRHGRYRDSDRNALPFTDDLLPRLIGIPVASDLSDSEIERVAVALQDGVLAKI